MEAFGRGLVYEPYLSTVVIGAGLVAALRQRGAEAGVAAQGRRWFALSRLRPRRARRALRSRAMSKRRRRRQRTVGGSTDTRSRCSTAVPRSRSSSRRGASNANGFSGKLCLFLRAGGNIRHDLARLSPPRRRPRLQPRPARCSVARGRAARRRQRCAARHRGRGRPRHGGARRGSRRHHADPARHHAGIHQDQEAVRPAAVRQPGDPPSPRRHGDAMRRGALDGAARGTDGRCRAGGARPRRVRRQSQDRQMRALRRRAIGATAWRHGRHRRTRHRRSISSGCSPSTRCSAAAPIIIAAMPRSAAAPTH